MSGAIGATVRTISREGCFSSGVIAHYFSNKDEMIRFAFEFVADGVFSQIDARLKQATGAERVCVILKEHVPIGKHDDATAVALAFWEIALHDDAMRAQFRDKYRRWRKYPRLEMRALSAAMPPDVLDRRINLAVAAAYGLPITFAMEGKRYRQIDRRAILDELMGLLGLSNRTAEAA